MNMEFCFEPTPWETLVDSKAAGDKIDALQFLALTEDVDTEEALNLLEEKGIGLDISRLGKIPTEGETAIRLRREAQLVRENKLLTDLSETDPLRLYLEELAATPAFGDMQLLAERYAAGEEETATQLVNGLLSLAVEAAKAYAGEGVLLLDLIQEGSLGLWQGILHYTEGDIYTHSRRWITFYLARAIVLAAQAAGVGQKMRQGMQDYLDADQRLLTELGRNPTTEEIAELLHITAEEAYAYGDMVRSARTKSQVEDAREEKEETPEDNMAVEDTAYFQSRQRISELLSGLSPVEAELLTMRFGLDGKAPASPEETAQKLKMTPEEVLQAEAAALGKLRADR